MSPPNFLLVTFPGQGHINPSLRFAERLIRIGCHVTFTTALSARRRMSDKSPPPEGLSFATFSDGHDDGVKEAGLDLEVYMEEVKQRGSETLRGLILENHARGTNFTHLFFTTLIPWAADVAHSLGLRSTLVWIQPATVFDIYYYYFNGYDKPIRSMADATTAADGSDSHEIRLPGMLPMTSSYVPSFFASTNQYGFSLPLMERHFDILSSEKTGTVKPKVLVNTFEELEPEALKAINDLQVIPVGPFIPSAFLDEQNPTNTSLGGDLFQNSGDLDYIGWLNKQQTASVIYISFGSISLFSRPQKEEMAKALIATGRPFLWVIRKKMGEEEKEGDDISYEEELSRLGMIVPWCSQVEVLSNPSVGCFVTHCGWNSTSESVVCGVPMVAFPQWSDQQTNSKLVEDVWRTGVHVGTANGEGVVEAGEIERCLEVVLGDGEKGRELRENAKKLGEVAKKAAKDGGSSDNNLRRFVDGLVKETSSELSAI